AGAARGVGPGRVPGRAQQRFQGLRGAALDSVGQFGQQLALPGLGRDDTGTVHHVTSRDGLEQVTFEALTARDDEIGGVPGEGVTDGAGVTEGAGEIEGGLRGGSGGRGVGGGCGGGAQGGGGDSLAGARVASWAATQKRPMSSLVRFFRAATVSGPPS